MATEAVEQQALCSRLMQLIQQRTAGRVHSLDVCYCPSGHVQVRGVVGSHYMRQLVLSAVIEALGQQALAMVKLDVEVRRPAQTTS